MTKKFMTLGSDERLDYAQKALLAAGWEIFASPAEAEVILGPVPWKDADTETILKEIRRGHVVVGGFLPCEIQRACKKAGAHCADIFMRADFATLNAVPTAEGAIAEAITRSEVNLHGNQALVLGYGKCGRVLAKKLAGLGACVTVYARRWKIACAAIADGFEVLDGALLPWHLPRFMYVFNTVPALILTEALLKKLPEDCTIIDIASAPGGTDFEAAKRLEITAALCPSLPRKYAPKAAGEAIAQTVRIILEELERKPHGKA